MPTIGGTLIWYLQPSPFTEISCKIKINTVDFGDVTKDILISNAEATDVAILKNKTTWDEEDLCDALSTKTGYQITLPLT